jgi:transcriptional regulator with XRE-family HTH domain
MSEKERTPFGARLVLARKAAKLTQVQAAKKVGMAQGTLAEAETSGSGSAYTAQLAALYGVRAGWLADGAGEMQEPSAWPFPSIDRARFDRLTADQKVEVQGVIRRMLADFEREHQDNPSGGSSNFHPESQAKFGT